MINNRMGRGFVLAVQLVLLAVAAPAAFAYPAHYFVITENSTTGELAVAHHQLVEMAGSPEGIASREAPTVRKSRLQARIVDKVTGDTRFATLVNGSPWLRGEFHGVDQIDGHHLLLDERHYVVRVPADGSALLELDGLDVNTASPSLVAAASRSRLVIDLDQARNTAAVVAPAQQALPAGWASGSLAANGPPSNRLDLLVVGDGYTAAQQAKFITDATNLANTLLNESPYSVYKLLINVTYLFVPSNQSGADKPACGDGMPVVVVDTAFDAKYCSSNLRRLLTVNTGKLTTAAANVPDWDMLLVLVNDSEYGGSGGFAAVASTHADAVEVMKHEFGHQFTDLDDEYDTPFPGFPGCSDLAGGPACGANVTNQTTRALIKWLGWILPATSTPTVGQLADPQAAGLWLGARYAQPGMYRQCFNGKMKSLNVPFCKVDSEAFVKKVYGGWGTGAPTAGISNIDPGALPATANVNVPVNTDVNFSATVVGSNVAGVLKVEWIVDGAPPSKTVNGNHNSVQTFTYNVPNTNTHTVMLRVSDMTTLLLQPNVRTQSWSVKGQGVIPNITLDVTGDGNPDALTDGLIIIRYLFNIGGNALIAGALGNNPVRADVDTVTNYLTMIRPQLDIDGNTQFDALTDGILMLRYMFSIRNDPLIAGVIGPNAARKTATEIANYLAPMMAPH